jgi:hypothetical protein
MPGLALKDGQYKHGTCKECADHLAASGVFFVDKAGRCVKVGLEASREKISAAFHGKVILIPKEALTVLIEEYLKANPNPPPLKFGNGDVTPAG